MNQPIFKLLAIVVLLVSLSACELTKKVLGISTQALEDARIDAISEEYHCDYFECFDAVLSYDRKTRAEIEGLDEEDRETDELLLEEGEVEEEDTVGLFDIFMKNRIKGYIVVMGVPGAVDTTEVGIFFSRIGDKKTRLEISSLASSAKLKIAETLFEELDLLYKRVEN